MSCYLYDGSFEGFLCAVACCLERGDRQPEFACDTAEADRGLFAVDSVSVETVREVALAFRRRFVAAVSQQSFATARYAFHSRRPGIEDLLWRYLELGLRVGRRLHSMLAQEPVYSVSRIARTVAHEAHTFKGFVRFREVEAGFLYAQIKPEADILALIAPHFTERVGDTPWLIHDLQRRQAAVFNLHSWQLVHDITLSTEPGYTPAEHDYAALWQRYFQHHAIAERHNPKLQQKHVPLQVRKHLTEFQPVPDQG